MSKKKILIIAVAVIVVVLIVGVFSVIYLPTILPRATTLTVSPSTFTLSSGESIALVASLTSDGLTLTGSSITWKSDIGTFDKSVGSSVIYKAPSVDSETTVTITVEFPGEGPYQPSKATITGKIIPSAAKSTSLIIVPSSFELRSGEKIVLKVEISPKDAPVDLVKWSIEGGGSLEPSTGVSVTYIAPNVDKETGIRIVAEFPGTKEYGRSTAEALGKVLPAGGAVRTATVLTVTPSSFTVSAGGEVKLTAELRDIEGETLADKPIQWRLEGLGTLSSSTGTSIIYKAPSDVKEETNVKIRVEFAGDENYLPSYTEVSGKITIMPTITEYAYQMIFEKAVFRNVKIEGPISMLGTMVTKVTGEVVEIDKLTLNPMGLKSESAAFQSVEFYTIKLSGLSSELGQKLDVTGEQQISITRDTLSLENGQVDLLHLTANVVELNKPELIGKHVGGAEPYIPVVVTAHTVVLKERYFLDGPKSYEELENMVNKMTAGRVEASDFTFTYPVTYSLDRGANSYSYKGVWTLSSSKLTGQNILIYLIYFQAKYGGFIVKGTGEDTASTIIPHGFNAGYESPPLPDAETHAVYFSADNLTLEKLVLQIAP
ncbi:MAG: hypothetical protein QW413_05280 [Nitrososphaerota archaeon]